MPSAEVGGDVRRNRALNCWPCVRSLTHSPEHRKYHCSATNTESGTFRDVASSLVSGAKLILTGASTRSRGQDKLPIRP